MIGSRPDFIERGTIVDANLGSVLIPSGSKQAGDRPAVVVSKTEMTAGSTVIVIPFTTKVQGRSRPYEVLLAPSETGLPYESAALVHHIQVVDKGRIQRRPGRVTDLAMARIDAAIRLVLDVA